MSDDLWMKELAQVNRDKTAEEQSRLDERWDRLSAGELSPEEEAELKALAETSGEAREAWEAFRPLGPEFHASVVQAIRKQGLAPQAGTTVPEPRKKVLPFRRRTPLWAGWSAVAAAAAASLFLFLRNPASQPPLPAYSIEVSGGVSAMRGEQEEVFAPGDRCTVILRPDHKIAPDKPLDADCFLARDGDLRPLEASNTFDPSGSVRMKVLIDRDIQPGAWTLLAVVGRQGKLPDLADLQRFSAQALVRQEDWVALAKEIKIQNRDLPP